MEGIVAVVPHGRSKSVWVANGGGRSCCCPCRRQSGVCLRPTCLSTCKYQCLTLGGKRASQREGGEDCTDARAVLSSIAGTNEGDLNLFSPESLYSVFGGHLHIFSEYNTAEKVINIPLSSI